jgi:tetratricopeptide (TPR) repeat protein
MDDDTGPDDERESYQLGPDGTPVDAGPDAPPEPEPETAIEHRQAARRALGAEDVETALERLDEALRLAREDGNDALVAGVLTDRGNVRLERADADEGDPRADPDTAAVRAATEAAIDDYTAALDADPENRDALFNRGLARARLGDRYGSTADLEHAADLGRGNPFLVRGNTYAEAGADEYAREDFTRAIDRSDTARAYFNRGNVNRRLGDEDAAVADYEAALDRADELPDDGLRVLVELGEVTADETAATHRVRAAFLAVAGRDVWRGVALAERALGDAAEGAAPWTDAAALVVAGDAIRGAAGYGPDDEVSVDVPRLRETLADTDLPDATAALVTGATAGYDAAEGAFDALDTDVDVTTAVSDRDHAALRRAAAAELGRQLGLYR